MRKLKKDKALIYSQKITGTQQYKTPMKELLLTKENRKVLGLPVMPYLYLYLIGSKKLEKALPTKLAKMDEKIKSQEQKITEYQIAIDTLSIQGARKKKHFHKKINKSRKKVAHWNDKKQQLQTRGNWLMRVSKDAPAYYDSQLVNQSVRKLKKYLFQKGYFDAEITAKANKNGRLVHLSYDVKQNEPFYIESKAYKIKRKDIETLFLKYDSLSHIVINERFEQETLEKERNQLYQILVNNGYYNFPRSAILFQIDTFLQTKQVLDIQIGFRNEAELKKLKRKHLRNIKFEVLSDTSASVRRSLPTYYENMTFYFYPYRYSKEFLGRNIQFRKGSLYQEQQKKNTLSLLGQMNLFKFANITYEPQEKDSLDVNIMVTPLNKYQYNLEFGGNLIQNRPGPFSSISLTTRNFLGHSDIFQVSARYALTAQTGAVSIANTVNQEIRLSAMLQFPYLLIPWRRKWEDQNSAFLPRSVLELNLYDTRRPEYSKVDLQLYWLYQWRKRSYETFDFRILDLNLVNIRNMTSEFTEQLRNLQKQGNNLIFSFDDYLISSIQFSYRQNVRQTEEPALSNFLQLQAEFGGAYINLYNAIAKRSYQEPALGLKYAEYILLATTFVRSLKINQNSLLVSRLHLGISDTYRPDKELPYQKKFFTGGTSSNRGWVPRRIGPGTFSNTGQQVNEQPGNIIFEANLEWRIQISDVWNTAFFLDASNVWTFDEDPARMGAQFPGVKALEQLYISGGWGLRWDFYFLLFRLDFGFPIFNPSKPPSERYLLPKLQLSDHIINLAIGYPF